MNRLKSIDPYYAFFTLIVGAIIIAMIAVGVHSWMYPKPYYTPLQWSMTQVAQCEATEEFTRDQCVILVGDGR